MEAQFKLDSGHEVYLKQLFIKRTMQGVLAGDPVFISQTILQCLPDKIRKVFWDCQATLILKPDMPILPDYTFVAHLVCLDSVARQKPGDYSRLLVAWFQHDLDGHVVEIVHRAVRSIEWEVHAENWID